MNTLTALASTLEKRPLKYDDFEDIDTGLVKFKVRVRYLITQYGKPNSREFGANNPDADGLPWEINFVAVSIVQIDTQEEIDRTLADFTSDELEKLESEIVERLEERDHD